MFQNIKTDIIYYNTNTDFELEFNLCGCCRMRLLNDKCSDRKSLLHSLARAVSRSKVIMIVAPLFGKENVTETVAQAIGTDITTADNQAFGIKSDDEISIIRDSTPLVTADGVFGGCIIESGPQTLIVLTDNKNIRKTIMKTLIHPYIEELFSLESNHESPNAEIEETDEEETIEEAEEKEGPAAEEPEAPEEVADQQQIIIDETPQEVEKTNIEEDIALAEQMLLEKTDEIPQEIIEEYDNVYDDLFIEPTKLNRKTVERFTAEYTYSQDSEHDYWADDFDTNGNSDSSFNIWLLIISIILLLTLAILCYCIFIVPSQSGVSPVAYLQEVYNTMFK